MTRPISWLERAPEMLHTVKVSKRPRYGAGDFQDLFGLQPSSAQKLMKMLPRFEVGMTLEVSREELIVFLKRVLAAAPPGLGHHAANKALADLFDQMLAAGAPVTREPPLSPAWPTRLTPRARSLASLPESILISRGHIHISGRTREEAAEALLALAGVIETEEFAERFELRKPVQRDTEAQDIDRRIEELKAIDSPEGLARWKAVNEPEQARSA
jgi:hypothetical protein